VNRDEDPSQQDDRVTGLEELRQEREIEERRFRVEDVVEEALYEARPPGAWRSIADPAVCGLTRRSPGRTEAQEPEYDEVAGADDLEHRERGGRAHEDRRDPDGRRRRVDE